MKFSTFKLLVYNEVYKKEEQPYSNNLIYSGYIIIVLFIALPLANYDFFLAPYVHPKLVIFSLLNTFGLFSIVLHLLKDEKYDFNFTFFELSIFICLVLFVIISINSIDLKIIIDLLNIVSLYIVLRFYIEYYQNKYSFINFYSILGFLAFLEIVVVVFGIYNNGIYTTNDRLAIKPQITGTFGNVNSVSIFFASLFPSLLLLVCKSSSLQKIFWIIITVFSFAIIILSQCRAAWVAILISAFLFVLYKKTKINNFSVSKIITIKGLVVLFGLILFTIPLININKESVTGRTEIWKTTSKIIADNFLLGIGNQNFTKKFVEYQARILSKENLHDKFINKKAVYVRKTFNEYIKILLKYGIVGFLLFSIIILYFFILVIKLLKIDSKQNVYILVSYLSILIVLIYAIFGNPLMELPLTVLTIFHLSLILSISRKKDIVVENYKGSYKKYLNVVNYCIKKKQYIYLLFAIALISLIYTFSTLLLIGRANNCLKLENYTIAKKYINSALFFQPNNGKLLFSKGVCELNEKEYENSFNSLVNSQKYYEDKNTYINIAYVLFHLGKFKLAEDYILEMKYKYPNLLAPYYLLGIVYQYMGQVTKSYEYFKYTINAPVKNESNDVKEIRSGAERNLSLLKLIINNKEKK